MWSYKHTFRHGQCDPAGIVYTPEFFNVFNHAVEDWFCNHLGINYYDVLGARRIGLGYVNASATFFTPCMMGDEVEIFVTISKIGGKSYQLCLHAMKGDNEALRGYFTTVITCLEKHRPTEMPDDIREAMKKYKAGT
ncbi:hypothetical protein RA27_17545 [Ruegeria sp. ANG-R]|nr:hypothetical protein RA27_17545 [Ruegeria sp. ANG-R]